MMKLIQSVLPLLSIFNIDTGRETAVTTRPALPQAWRRGGIVPLKEPTQADREVAEIILCNQFGLLSRLDVLERAGNVLLVDVDIILTTWTNQLADDPVVPLVLKPTGFIFNWAFRRFVQQVAMFNSREKRAIWFSYRRWYRVTRRWAWLLCRTAPLSGGEWEYFCFHIYKTLNNPTRRS